MGDLGCLNCEKRGGLVARYPQNKDQEKATGYLVLRRRSKKLEWHAKLNYEVVMHAKVDSAEARS